MVYCLFVEVCFGNLPGIKYGRFSATSPLLKPVKTSENDQQIFFVDHDTVDQAFDTAVDTLHQAFDTVDHEILIRKLKVYGIDGTELEWFRSYLSCRLQYCTLNGHKSSSQQVTCGILQGSCLGPLSFILYLNDFESCLKSSPRLISMQMIRKFHSRRKN